MKRKYYINYLLLGCALAAFATCAAAYKETDSSVNVLQNVVMSKSEQQVTSNLRASNVAASDYIQIRLVENALPAQEQVIRNAFLQAGERWSRIIRTRHSPLTVQRTQTINFCGVTSEFTRGETVDNLLILASVVSIDGVGSILGSAAPCAPVSGLPRVGIMQFDSADVANLIRDNSLDAVVEHEMGHVLGIGSFWQRDGLLIGAQSNNPQYSGQSGILGFQALGGQGFVPVENTGGQGTRLSHWRQSVFGNELMTGFLTGNSQPISIMTINSLEDLGYEVDRNQAEFYRIPGFEMPDADDDCGIMCDMQENPFLPRMPLPMDMDSSAPNSFSLLPCIFVMLLI